MQKQRPIDKGPEKALVSFKDDERLKSVLEKFPDKEEFCGCGLPLKECLWYSE